MKAPRSRQEATSGAVPLAKRGRLERAARLVEGAPQGLRRAPCGWPRRGPRRARRAAPRAPSRRPSSGSWSAASTTAQSSSRPPVACGATTAGQPAAASAASSVAPRPAGSRRRRRAPRLPRRSRTAPAGGAARRLQPPAERPGEHVARQPPLGLTGDPPAHQLQRHDRHRLLQDQPLEVPEAARVADDHHPGLRRPAAGRDDRMGRAPARPRRGARARTGARRRRAPAPSRRMPPIASADSWRRKPRPASRSPRPSRIATVPPTAEATVAAISSSPRSSSTSRSSRRWIASPRCRTSYCSLTRRVNAFSVIAMNGVE